MVTQIAPLTFQYSHTIGRQEVRNGDGFFHPVAIARGEGNLLYVLSRGTETPAFFPCKRVTVFTVDEELVRDFGQKVPPEDADSSAPDGSFMWPTSVALDSESNAYVADEWLNRISIFDKDGDWIGKWGTPGDGDGEINRPSGLAFDANDNLYLVDSLNNRVQVFNKEGRFQFKWGESGSGDGEFNNPWGIEIDQAGDVYVADWRNDRIQKFGPGRPVPDEVRHFRTGGWGVQSTHRSRRRQGRNYLRDRLQERPPSGVRRGRRLYYQADRRGNCVQVGEGTCGVGSLGVKRQGDSAGSART